MIIKIIKIICVNLNNLRYVSAKMFAIVALAFVSCAEINTPDGDASIFDLSTPELTAFDQWLRENFVDTYNINVIYKYSDYDTHLHYNVVPADVEQSKKMAFLVKYLWLDAYTEAADNGIHFLRANAPRVLQFTGSGEWSSSGTMSAGSAEGIYKITINDVNSLDQTNIAAQLYYFETMHHEFGHFLHFAKDYPPEFSAISRTDYLIEYHTRDSEEAAQTGFVSAYAGLNSDEDFVETLAAYIVYDDEWWDKKLQEAQAKGSEIILRKVDLIRRYMLNAWGIDLDLLRTIVQRRIEEAPNLDINDILGF